MKNAHLDEQAFVLDVNTSLACVMVSPFWMMAKIIIIVIAAVALVVVSETIAIGIVENAEMRRSVRTQQLEENRQHQRERKSGVPRVPYRILLQST